MTTLRLLTNHKQLTRQHGTYLFWKNVLYVTNKQQNVTPYRSYGSSWHNQDVLIITSLCGEEDITKYLYHLKCAMTIT